MKGCGRGRWWWWWCDGSALCVCLMWDGAQRWVGWCWCYGFTLCCGGRNLCVCVCVCVCVCSCNTVTSSSLLIALSVRNCTQEEEDLALFGCTELQLSIIQTQAQLSNPSLLFVHTHTHTGAEWCHAGGFMGNSHINLVHILSCPPPSPPRRRDSARLSHSGKLALWQTHCR